ncbi:hypothetical protein RRG08_025130 [Elysia crispata]|uniref:Uncharacterized protein n=1 Tax=Elysia crispata TaxID=231223 RepID=A0AAE0ZV31_9GAST|nr:hypothetical protein RRG08_025130 [Elysia crispata]
MSNEGHSWNVVYTAVLYTIVEKHPLISRRCHRAGFRANCFSESQITGLPEEALSPSYQSPVQTSSQETLALPQTMI